MDGEHVVTVGPPRAAWPGQGVSKGMLIMGRLLLQNEPHIRQPHLLLCFLCVRVITEISVYLRVVIV